APDDLTEYGNIDSTDLNHVTIIDASTGEVTLDGVRIGEFDGGGNVVQNGGLLNFDGFTETKIGGEGPNPSTWVMNGNATILYEDPLGAAGAGYGADGPFGNDFDVGNGLSEATLELNDNAVLRISDDLKVSDNGVAAGATISLNDNAQVTIGSGTSIGDDGPALLSIAGDSLYVSGNSAGPGNVDDGYTNEGYLTMHQVDIDVRDNGRLWIRTLQHRGGEASITVGDNARFDIFDVYFHEAPELGVTTVQGDVNGSERTSTISESAGDVATVIIEDNGVMTVDSDVPGSAWSGLALSGGNNRGGNGGGGETLVEVRDQGSFTVQQDLHMTLGTEEAAASTLKVRGPDASVAVNGDLRMALDEFGDANFGSATLHAVITAATHSTIQVGGDVNIDNGNLVVELDGFTPFGGESYELISAGTVTGDEFLSVDVDLAPLLDGLSWEVAVDGSSVLLNVLGSAGVPGDFDGDGQVDGADLLLWQRGGSPDPLSAADLATWEANFGAGATQAAAISAVPEPRTIWLLFVAAVSLGFQIARRRNA
ncbi:MAG: PEP-CTERM sorting domain-containing protein, partial [Planctomycetota bacterium]